jgi:hypothetical protein
MTRGGIKVDVNDHRDAEPQRVIDGLSIATSYVTLILLVDLRFWSGRWFATGARFLLRQTPSIFFER